MQLSDTAEFSAHDAETLVRQVERMLETRYRPARHQIATGIMTTKRHVYLGLHVEAMVGRASVCAESGALTAAAMANDLYGPALIYTVRHARPQETNREMRPVAPCGTCREVLTDYFPEGLLIATSGADPRLERLGDLLPAKYQGSKWSNS